MNAPDRIFTHPTERCPVSKVWMRGKWKDHDSGASGDVEYIRRDPAVIAALPEVQALIAAEREACLNLVIEEAEYQLEVSKTQFARGMSWGATDWAWRSLNVVAAAIRAARWGGV